MNSDNKKKVFHQDFMKYPHVQSLVGKAPTMLSYKKEFHIMVFRNLLHISILQGRWSGFVPKVS